MYIKAQLEKKHFKTQFCTTVSPFCLGQKQGLKEPKVNIDFEKYVYLVLLGDLPQIASRLLGQISNESALMSTIVKITPTGLLQSPKAVGMSSYYSLNLCKQ